VETRARVVFNDMGTGYMRERFRLAQLQFYTMGEAVSSETVSRVHQASGVVRTAPIHKMNTDTQSAAEQVALSTKDRSPSVVINSPHDLSEYGPE
jgi:hypothetical protein